MGCRDKSVNLFQDCLSGQTRRRHLIDDRNAVTLIRDLGPVASECGVCRPVYLTFDLATYGF